MSKHEYRTGKTSVLTPISFHRFTNQHNYLYSFELSDTKQSRYIKMTQCGLTRRRFSTPSGPIGLYSTFKQLNLLLISRASANSAAPESVILLHSTSRCVKVRFDRSALAKKDAPEVPISLHPQFRPWREVLLSRAFARALAPEAPMLFKDISKKDN